MILVINIAAREQLNLRQTLITGGRSNKIESKIPGGRILLKG